MNQTKKKPKPTSTERVHRFNKRQKERGLTHFRIWVPESKITEIKEVIKRIIDQDKKKSRSGE